MQASRRNLPAALIRKSVTLFPHDGSDLAPLGPGDYPEVLDVKNGEKEVTEFEVSES